MKKRNLILLFCIFWHISAPAANLVEVYRQALISDPTYQQAIAERCATKENVPINIAQILPNIAFSLNPAVTRTGYSGTALNGTSNIPFSPRNNTLRSYVMTLTVNQTVFNFAQFYQIAGAVDNAKAADADINAALQNLMTRVANAYFAVLKDEDNVAYATASKIAFREQLDQAQQQFEVGLKTITDVYTAQASYDTAVATLIGAETTLTNDRENLRVITGVYYPKLATLSEQFPLISPQPQDIELWVKTAYAQNWSIKSSQFKLQNALQVIKQNMSGYFPTIALQGTMDRNYALNINGYMALINRNGPGTITNREIALILNWPIFSGGAVTAQTNQARFRFESAQQQLEKTMRDTINTTRQSYLAIIAGISKIKADKQAIKSAISSAEGLEESYRVGTETLVNVLNQQQNVYLAQTNYAQDRYTFINNIFALKQAAGTLGFEDLLAINDWLEERKTTNSHLRSNYTHRVKKQCSKSKHVRSED